MTDGKMENIVGNLLRAGVVLSAAMVFCGGVSYLIGNANVTPDYSAFHGEPAELRHVSGILRGAVRLHSKSLIQLGLLMLIATPIARVAFCIWGFALERDRMYVLFTIVVLAVLLISLATGKG